MAKKEVKKKRKTQNTKTSATQVNENTLDQQAISASDAYTHTELHPSMLDEFLHPEVLFLIGVSIVLLGLKNEYAHYSGWFVLLVAVFLPLIRQLSKR